MTHDPRPEDFEAQLRQALQGEPEPADDGFTSRVMARLPALAASPLADIHKAADFDPRHHGLRQQRRRAVWRIAHRAHIVATGLAAVLLASLSGRGLFVLTAEQQLAAWTLNGLMAIWSVPICWDVYRTFRRP
jgi:hypothetical protein